MSTEPDKKKLFVKGAHLLSGINEELTEEEFIKRAGLKNLKELRNYPYVSLILDNPKKPILVGHKHERTIALAMQGRGHKRWQTMEWRK
jgi:hypothetical protein